MRAVNLIPSDAPRGARVTTSFSAGPGFIVLGLLAVALAFVSVYVLTNNTISQRKSKLATLQQEAAATEAQASRLTNYSKFAQLAQARISTVKQLASSRFDWYSSLSDLSKVVPANTSLQSLLGTVAPGASINGPGGSVGGGTGGASTSALRADISAPAFELKGCTKTQDDVARLMSRLRVMNGVTRVTLADSAKQDQSAGGASVSSSTTSSTSTSSGPTQGCSANSPSFDLVVFFQPLPGAPLTTGAAGTAPSAPATGTAATTTTSATTTTAATTTAATPVTGATPPATTTPVSTATPGGTK